MKDYLNNLAHRRYNILTEQWVLVSPHRTKRPWQGQQEEIPKVNRPSYDESCYLCPGNKRANGEQNPNYEDVFIFENDFAALTQNNEVYKTNNGLIKAETEFGICKVVCFSPDHSKSLAQMSINEIRKVILAWQSEYVKLGREEAINYVQIFENRGEVMGCSNPHPHGQIWSQSSLPNEVDKKDKSQRRYFLENNRSMLVDYLKQELEINERIVFENRSYVVLVPFWAIWPFEVMILPKSHQNNIYQIPPSETILFAEAISVITKAYDKLFNCSFPYSSGIHQAPTNNANNEHWHWHMCFYPPLLRSATIKKFMVGYEMFASPQRDITSEAAAKALQSLV